MNILTSIHTVVVAGNRQEPSVQALLRRATETWDESHGHLQIEVLPGVLASNGQTMSSQSENNACRIDLEEFACVGLLTGEARFLYSRDGVSILTDSFRFLDHAFDLSLDPGGLAEEMSRLIPERSKTKTAWDGVRRVPPGFRAYLRSDNVWDIAALPIAQARPISTGEGLQSIMRAAVLRSVDNASNVVADLSGGMDSTSVCAILTELGVAYSATHVTSSDVSNMDQHYADMAAAALGQSIQALGDTRMVAGTFDTTFHGPPAALSESLPSWVGGDMGFALRAKFASEARHDVYLVGLGGDELFSMQLGALLAGDRRTSGTSRYRPLLRSIAAAGSIQANLRMLRNNLLAPGQEARARLARERNKFSGTDDALADLGWMPGLAVPGYLKPSMRAGVENTIIDFADSDNFVLHEERFKHVMFESLIKQSKTLASVNRNFGTSNLRFSAPFLDPELIDYVISLDSSEFSPEKGHKHILKEAVGDALPAVVRDRPDKGELSSELYQSFAANRGIVRRHLDNSYLVDLGIVDGDSLRAALSRSMYSTSSLMELEEIYHAEKWVRQMDSRVGVG